MCKVPPLPHSRGVVCLVSSLSRVELPVKFVFIGFEKNWKQGGNLRQIIKKYLQEQRSGKFFG